MSLMGLKMDLLASSSHILLLKNRKYLLNIYCVPASSQDFACVNTFFACYCY